MHDPWNATTTEPPARRHASFGLTALAALALTTLSQACSAKIQSQRVSDVERVAIVEYQATIEGASEKPIWAKIASAVNDEAAKAGDEAYDMFADGLRAEFSWAVVPRERLIENARYVAIKHAHEGTGLAALTMMGTANTVDYRPTDVMRAYSNTQLSADERDDLLDALGVDALVTCWMSIRPAGKWGVGPFSVTKYKASAKFRMFDRSGEIWFDPAATGESSEGVKRISIPLAGAQEVGEQGAEKLSFFQALAAAQERLIDRYREAVAGA